jgi:hypothetical protein
MGWFSMRGSLLRWVAALVVLHPGLALAQWSIRLALEAPLHTHVFLADGMMTSTSIADSFQPGVDLLGGYSVLETLSIDLEFQTGIAATGGYARTRTLIGPGLTYDPHFPLYGRFAVPIQVESGVVVYLRFGGGWKFVDLGFFRAYFELTADLALGSNNGVQIGSHSVNAALGIWFRM